MTELEGCVLGVVWLRGPCTAYVVRQEFLGSGSSHWSGSAGAIYPLLRRLQQQKLVRSRSRTWGSGKKELFDITRSGLAVMHEWMGPPLEFWTAKPTFDPVRTRITFLGALPAAKRRRFLGEARANAAAALRQAESTLEQIDAKRDPFEYLPALAVAHELRARVEWLAAAARCILGGPRRKSFAEPPP